jgi:hypothetical protein
MMKLSKFSVLLSVALLFAASANVALARPNGFTGGHSGFSGGHGTSSHGHSDFHGGSNWHGHGHGWRGFYGGIYIDPWFYPWDYYPWGVTYPGVYAYGADPDAVVMPPPPQTYIQPGPDQQYAPAEAPPSQSQSSDWYYCRNPEGYYPYVKSCSTDWQRVPSRPAN